MYIQFMSQSLPAQHGVWLSCEDGGIHHKSCIVHNERYSFSQSQSTAMPLFTAEVIHIDHIAQSLADCLGVVLCSRRNKGSRYVSPDQGPSKMGIGKRNPGRSWTGGSWGRASVATFTIWGRGRHMNTTEACCYKTEKKQWLGKWTLTFIYFFSPHHAAEWEKWHSWCRASADSPLSHGRSHVSGRWSVAVAPGNVLLLLSLSPLQQHHCWPRPHTDSWCWPAACGGRSPTLTSHTVGHCWRDESTNKESQSCEHVFHVAKQQQNLEWPCWMLVNMLFRLDWSILLVIFGDTTMSGGLNLSFSKNKRCPKAAWLQMCYPFIIQFQLEKDGNNFISNQFGTSKLGIHRTSVKEPLKFFFFQF